MTKQDVYEAVRHHFMQPEGQFGYNSELEICVYRGDGDPDSPIRCGIGVLIPDGRYYRAIEGVTVNQFYAEQWFQDFIVQGDELPLEFLDRIQVTHDEVAKGWQGEATIERFIAKLDEFAKYEGLRVATEA